MVKRCAFTEGDPPNVATLGHRSKARSRRKPEAQNNGLLGANT